MCVGGVGWLALFFIALSEGEKKWEVVRRGEEMGSGV